MQAKIALWVIVLLVAAIFLNAIWNLPNLLDIPTTLVAILFYMWFGRYSTKFVPVGGHD